MKNIKSRIIELLTKKLEKAEHYCNISIANLTQLNSDELDDWMDVSKGDPYSYGYIIGSSWRIRQIQKLINILA